MTIPQMPMFNTPETFGRALSYEGQIHAVLGWYDENADYVNGVREDIDHAVGSLETLDGLMEQAQVAIPAATDAASAANTATDLANAATSRANTATGNANTAATRADNAAESIESYPLVVAEKMVNPGTAQFLDFGNLAVSGDSTKDGVTVTVDGTELSFSGSNTKGNVFFNFHPDNSIGFHPNTVYHAWMDVVPHDSISRPIDVVLILFGYDSDLQKNTEIVRVGTQSTGRKEFSFVDPVGYELYTITVYIGTNKTDMTVVPHFDAVMDNALLSEAETSILSTGISWLSDTLHEGPDVVSTDDFTIFRPEWGTRVDVLGTFASDYEYRIRFDDYYRYIEHDRTYFYRLDGRIPFTASILGISGNGLVQEEETILDTVTNVPGNPAYGSFHIPAYDYDWYDIVYTIPAGTYATNRSLDLRFGTIPDNVYLKRLIDAIGTESILDGSITTQKLADGAVTTPKLSNASVTTEKIADDDTEDVATYLESSYDINNRYSIQSDYLAPLLYKLCFMVTTDVHDFKQNYLRMCDFYYAHRPEMVEDVINLGDFVYDGYEDNTTLLNNEVSKKSLFVLGNHDVLTQGGTATNEQAYSRYYAANIGSWGVVQPTDAASLGLCYYYKDYPAPVGGPMRVIVLDEYHYDQAQHDWFAGVLSDCVSSGTPVVVCVHQQQCTSAEIVPLDSSYPFACPTGGYNNQPYSSGYSGTYANAYINRRKAVDSFIAAGGEFVCWMAGHTHRDCCGYFNEDHGKQIMLTFINTSQSAISKAFIKSNYSGDSFQYVAFDLTRKNIYVARIGTTVDLWMHNNGFMVCNYDTVSIVEYR